MILFICSSYIAIDVFLNSFIVVSTHHRRIASETGLKQDSLNPDSDSLIESTFLQNLDSDSLCIRIRICLIEYPLKVL